GAAQAFRIDAVDVAGVTEPITLAVPQGESAKSVETLLAATNNGAPKRSDQARELILDLTEANPAGLETDTLDAQLAAATGLKARTVRDVRIKLNVEVHTKATPEKDDDGEITRWLTVRTQAPREPQSLTHSVNDSGLDKPKNPESYPTDVTTLASDSGLSLDAVSSPDHSPARVSE